VLLSIISPGLNSGTNTKLIDKAAVLAKEKSQAVIPLV
jgi:hypothetical protein